ncbi:glycoside hydrolase family 1 protein [Bombilactobacillus thymidiniphilus]|uniref:Glycoside hydrolase family 1 protein n=1 Tax=Bombilactobacillus thymidiniphilus TaxID=2923363 RepID=A0ABY4PBV1_9LACO|nr:glycoside hydrolase family 1 protein [Bombilactobacillus thymidiniphilus]UQS83095.1 glycoside hydrolase family 1 protein [Bombilactobacillus thymidiniphilus]
MLKKDFLWGASLSAHQTEGAYQEDGKSLSVQDTRPRSRNEIADFTVASDHYHHYREDIKLMAKMGVKAMRISIPWTRIIPTGIGAVNTQAIEHYRDVFNVMHEYHIEPMVTTYHFDLPQELQAQGGWTNRQTVNAYEQYVRVLFAEFGEQVKYWLTINEPNIMLLADKKILGFIYTHEERYKAFYNLMIAEKLAFKACHELCAQTKIGPVPNISYVYPATSDPRDVRAAEYFNAVRNWAYLDFSVRGIINPIFKNYLKKTGIELAILPEDQDLVTHNFPDFLGLNYYTSVTVEYPRVDQDRASGVSDQQSEDIYEKGFYKGLTNVNLAKNDFNWTIDPLGLQTTLEVVNDRYLLPIYITENGLGAYDELTDDHQVHDDYRIAYLQQHLQSVQQAVDAGVDVAGYLPWSALDLVSVHEGMKKRYGFIYVDRTETDLKNLARYPKDSYFWYQQVIHNNGVD